MPPLDWAQRYQREIIHPLDPAHVVEELLAVSTGGRPVVLLCWEVMDANPPQFCHRSLVSLWLKETLNLDVCEVDDRHCRCGSEHPLLPGEFKAAL